MGAGAALLMIDFLDEHGGLLLKGLLCIILGNFIVPASRTAVDSEMLIVASLFLLASVAALAAGLYYLIRFFLIVFDQLF